MQAAAMRGVCSVDGCGRPARCRGWCRPHYKRWRKWGMVLAAIPIGDSRMHTVQKQCEGCGKTYRAARSFQRYCPNCRREAQHKLGREWMRRMWHDPIRGPILRERHRRWREEHPDRVKEAQDRCYLWPCPLCGKLRRVSRPGKEAKRSALCRQCRIHSRPKTIVYTRCYWCEDLVERPPWRIRKFTHQWHHECHGEMRRAGQTLGLTRERVRQLVNKEYAELNRDGQHATRAEALAVVIARREEN